MNTDEHVATQGSASANQVPEVIEARLSNSANNAKEEIKNEAPASPEKTSAAEPEPA